jgi:hypothetical protein
MDRLASLLQSLPEGQDSGKAKRSTWVDIHEDDMSVPHWCLANPHTFEPCDIKRGQDGWRQAWGIPEREVEDRMDEMQRQMQTEPLYGFGRNDTPEVQWVKALQQRKLDQLKQLQPAKIDLVIDMELDDVTPRWRCVCVSAATPLLALQDKVRLCLHCCEFV